ncbi:MAG: alpha-L-fucosidase [Capsulimonadaceae bacterium]|nr:alpha-L-fucosidase [Capsulimonadaceae bacterium]
MHVASGLTDEPRRTEWFRDARFGLFIHWGLYSLLAREAWVMDSEQIPREKYRAFAADFHPDDLDFDEWAQLAKRAGAKYVVFTSRHHDGFALFDSKASDFNSMQSTGRDFVREYVAAVRRAGLKVGLYYSLMSWQFPAVYAGPIADPPGWEAMVRQSHEQVQELMSNYGPIDLLWYDGCVIPGASEKSRLASRWRSRGLNAMVRSLQPHIVINDRSGLPEDFDTPEQHISAPGGRRLWEACMTFNNHWGYCETDHAFKSVREILAYLVYCARYRGNLLLNIGPRADGSVPTECVDRLKVIGSWLATNGIAIYGSERRSITEHEHPSTVVTARGAKAYVHLLDQMADSAHVAGIRGPVAGTRILGSDAAVNVTTLRDGTVQITGLAQSRERESELPRVVEIDMNDRRRFGKVTGILSTPPAQGRELDATVPIIGADTGRAEPPRGVVAEAREFALASPLKLTLTNASEWCPEWGGRQVATAEDRTITAPFHVNVSGVYDFEIGVVNECAGRISTSIDSTISAHPGDVVPGGYPATISLKRIVLAQGWHSLALAADTGNRIGVYGVRLSACWQGIPSELWATAGPYSSAFRWGGAVSTVRSALLTPYLTDEYLHRPDIFAGDGVAPSQWRIERSRRGEHSAQGVEYACRGQADDWGVCYARAVVVSPDPRDVEIAFGCDWWANLTLNGRSLGSDRAAELVAEDGAMFCGHKPVAIACRFDAGENVLIVKSHPGRHAHWFTMFINNPGDLTFVTPMEWSHFRRGAFYKYPEAEVVCPPQLEPVVCC